ncbi:hypothetical protein D9M71_232090 [compost metagenome]
MVDPQRSFLQRGTAGVTVVTSQDQRPDRTLAQVAAAADQAIEGQQVGAGEGERGIVDDIADNGATEGIVADLQGAPTDGGSAGIGVLAAQDQGAAAGLGQPIVAGQYDGDGRVAAEYLDRGRAAPQGDDGRPIERVGGGGANAEPRHGHGRTHRHGRRTRAIEGGAIEAGVIPRRQGSAGASGTVVPDVIRGIPVTCPAKPGGVAVGVPEQRGGACRRRGSRGEGHAKGCRERDVAKTETGPVHTVSPVDFQRPSRPSIVRPRLTSDGVITGAAAGFAASLGSALVQAGTAMAEALQATVVTKCESAVIGCEAPKPPAVYIPISAYPHTQ